MIYSTGEVTEWYFHPFLEPASKASHLHHPYYKVVGEAVKCFFEVNTQEHTFLLVGPGVVNCVIQGSCYLPHVSSIHKPLLVLTYDVWQYFFNSLSYRSRNDLVQGCE